MEIQEYMVSSTTSLLNIVLGAVHKIFPIWPILLRPTFVDFILS